MASLKDQFFAVKRRTTQIVLEKMGKAEATPDEEYEARKDHALKQYEQLKRVNGLIERYLAGVRAACIAASDLGEEFATSFAGGDPELQRTSAAHAAAVKKVDLEIRKTMDDDLVENILASIKLKLDEFNDLKQKMGEREQLKVDVDAYTRNVRELKQKPGPSAAKLQEKEQKLAAAQAALDASTTQVYEIFDKIEAQAPLMLYNEFKQVLASQKMFYGSSFRTLESVGELPNISVPAFVRPTPKVAEERKTASASTPTAAAGAGGAGAGGAAGGERVEALFPYEPQSADELKLNQGDIIIVQRKQDDGWWEGRIGDRVGVFPANYVRPAK